MSMFLFRLSLFSIFNKAHLFNRNNDEWYKTRQALAPKLLRPQEVYDNADNFNSVVEDAIKSFRDCRNGSGEISDVQRLLFRWTCECMVC